MSEREEPAVESRRIIHETLIDAPIAAVWRAVTSPELVAEWLGVGEIRPEAGHRFVLTLVDDKGVVSHADGEVLEVDPERRLRFSLVERAPGDEDAEIRSVVQIELVPTEDGVRFRLTHEGFERVAATSMVWAVAQQRILRIRRAPASRRDLSIVTLGARRLAWAA
jgi:uncharacterized protein YndB with AHSA1/START domain